MTTTTNDLSTLPLLPLKQTVIFPTVLQPIVAGRAASVAAVDAALESEDKEILLVAQRDGEVEDPSAQDLFTVGTRAVIKKAARLPHGPVQIAVQGVERAVIARVERTGDYLSAKFRPAPVKDESGARIEALKREILALVNRMLELTKTQLPGGLSQFEKRDQNPLELVYFIASIVSLELEKEQALLEASTVFDAMTLLHGSLTHEVQVLELREEISSQARTEIDREQREYMLRQQLRAIQRELGDDGEGTEVEDLRKRVDELTLPKDVRKEVDRDLGRLERLNTASPEYGVLRGYLEFLVELPWNKRSEGDLDIPRARQVLEDDHFGLEEVKRRILEHLAVLRLNPNAKSPILCFVGPPGVGKTSLGQSIARALGREFTRMSLGGLHDEAELRGHRRTYIGAMPGRILQALRRIGTRDPVLMLDEIDKLGRDFRGDPAAALLEILDPEQNREFRDNFLDLPFDLSKVFFILTANTLDTIPGPLQDRLEIIRFSGYTEEEKLEIAKRYLIPRQLSEVGLDTGQCELTDEALRRMIAGYTREAGVRQLHRRIGNVFRKIALDVAEAKESTVRVDAGNLADLLGPEKFFMERIRQKLDVGVAQGLAWTPTGGDVLYVEATLLPRGKGLTLTGQLGDVMRESASTAQSYVWSHARELDVDPDLFKANGVHVHVPAGAIPKDGPSAGITIATALTSLYTGRPVRKDTALTGEVTLTGLVLPVGGIKEKVHAARRSGLARVVLSKENERDLSKLPDYVTEDLEFVLVESMKEVIEAALEPRRCGKRMRHVG